MCDTASLSRVGMLAASSGVSVAMSTDGADGYRARLAVILLCCSFNSATRCLACRNEF